MKTRNLRNKAKEVASGGSSSSSSSDNNSSSSDNNSVSDPLYANRPSENESSSQDDPMDASGSSPPSDVEDACERLKKRSAETFRVIDPSTMTNIGIDEQFQSLAKTLGIWDFLIGLRTCDAFVKPTHEFLSTFEFKEQVSFQLIGQRYSYTLHEFNKLLGFPTDGVHQYDMDKIKETWEYISGAPSRERSRKSNAIRHTTLQYFHRALSNSVFARGETHATVNYCDLSFMHFALYRLGGFGTERPNVGYFLANNILRVVHNKKATGPVGLAGVVHFIAQKLKLPVPLDGTMAIKVDMDLAWMRASRILDESQAPYFAKHKSGKTELPLMPMIFNDRNTWGRRLTQREAAPPPEEPAQPPLQGPFAFHAGGSPAWNQAEAAAAQMHAYENEQHAVPHAQPRQPLKVLQEIQGLTGLVRRIRSDLQTSLTVGNNDVNDVSALVAQFDRRVDQIERVEHIAQHAPPHPPHPQLYSPPPPRQE